MTFNLGDYVRITPDFPFLAIPKGATGHVVDLPNEEHPNEYQIKLERGVIYANFLEGRTIWISAAWLEPAKKDDK